MNSDLYYIKYLKYKTKYLQEKSKIEGGGIFGHNCKTDLLIELKDKIKTLQYLPEIINLIQNSDKNKIIVKLKQIYDNAVFSLLKLDKKCLAPQLNKYLKENQEGLVKNNVLKVQLQNKSELIFTSLNVKEKDNKFISEIINDGKFSKGTAFISDFVKNDSSELKFTRNLRYLTNLMHIKFKISENVNVESLRFGIPYAPEGITDFYNTQIIILKDYVKKKQKKCLFISFLDPCDSIFCVKLIQKVNEDTIIRQEIIGYDNKNFVYLNMPCNNSVNLSPNLSTISDSNLKKEILKYLDKLETWTKDANGKEILQQLRNNDDFFNMFKKNVSNNDGSNPKLERLKIRKFVLKKKPKEQLNNFDNLMKQFSPCEEDLTNEHIRLVMFCYISLIFYILSKNNPNEYILLYHCKSGQDRTGTFYAINQMVNQITTQHYDTIVCQIMAGNSFIDIFYEFYSLTKENKPIPQEKKYCPPNPKEVLIENIKDQNINKDVELCYLRFLLFSYMMTITSTGVPGLKWGLTNTQFGIRLVDKRKYDTNSSVDNRFPYLLLKKPIYAIMFEGASKMRGD